jgi:quinol-cytochrome oxidoreductase complex cytochrome b subunit/cytochrome c2
MYHLWKWFTDRWPFYQLRDLLLEEDIPGGASFAYTIGSSIMMIFALQVASGILQLFYYVPTTDHAYNSVSYLRTEVPFGWLIHNMHYWGANAMVFLVALHMARVYIWGAYKKTPLTWFIGIALVLTVMALSFTGAPLIWDQKGYWAGEVGSSIAGEVPIVGDLMKTVLRGGETMGQLALSRSFVFHIGVFVPLLALLIGMHIASFRTSGVGGPWDREKQKNTGPFWPDQAFKDLTVATVVLLALIGLSVFFPVSFAGLADTLNTSYVPKPEWNFLFVYQALKYFKGPLEPLGAAGVPAVFVLLLVLVPLIDRNTKRNPFQRPFAMACFVLYGGLIVTLSVIGYLSPGFAQPAAASKQEAEKAPPQVPPEVKRGEQIFQKSGCLGCHKVHGNGGSVGPELSGEALKGKSRTWLMDQITNSTSHFPSMGPNTGMTEFTSLGKKDLDDLVSYLMSLAGGGQTPAETSAGAGSKPGAAQKSSGIKKGGRFFQSKGCTGCHKVYGKGGSIGPELSGNTLKGKSRQWLEDQIRNPKSHFPNTIMPAFSGLSKDDLDDLVSYLMSLAGGSSPESVGEAPSSAASSQVRQHSQTAEAEPAKPARPAKAAQQPAASVGSSPQPPTEEKALTEQVGEAAFIVGSAENGASLFKEQCISCHGPEGKDNVPNPGSDDGTVPPLNPIDRALYNTDPRIFVEHIDKLIQHGSMPSGPHPALHMPAWGDSRSLTQQEIANLEAYILELNGVNRAKIINPGLEPETFFFIVLGLFVIAALMAGGAWARRRRE